MTCTIYQIDAFTDKIFGGNPAAVCPLDHWPSDEVLHNIAVENNLAETAFFIHQEGNKYHLRWFTPEIEIDLCGHATLASAFVIFNELDYAGDELVFESKSGILKVKKLGAYLELDFPSRPPIKSDLPAAISDALNIRPVEVWKSRDYMLIYKSEEEVKNLVPDMGMLNQINISPGGIIATAEGAAEDVDFVSRFFTPQASVFEDPVTGSAHCTLVPYWSIRLGQTSHRALQVSNRGGELLCQLQGDRVTIKGKAVKYLEGRITI